MQRLLQNEMRLWMRPRQLLMQSLLWTITSTLEQWTVPQLSIMIIYNSTWSILMQWIRDILSGDNLTWYTQEKAYFLFVINLITRTMDFSKCGRKLKMCGTMHYRLNVCSTLQCTANLQCCVYISINKLNWNLSDILIVSQNRNHSPRSTNLIYYKKYMYTFEMPTVWMRSEKLNIFKMY